MQKWVIYWFGECIKWRSWPSVTKIDAHTKRQTNGQIVYKAEKKTSAETLFRMNGSSENCKLMRIVLMMQILFLNSWQWIEFWDFNPVRWIQIDWIHWQMAEPWTTQCTIKMLKIVKLLLFRSFRFLHLFPTVGFFYAFSAVTAFAVHSPSRSFALMQQRHPNQAQVINCEVN